MFRFQGFRGLGLVGFRVCRVQGSGLRVLGFLDPRA